MLQNCDAVFVRTIEANPAYKENCDVFLPQEQTDSPTCNMTSVTTNVQASQVRRDGGNERPGGLGLNTRVHAGHL